MGGYKIIFHKIQELEEAKSRFYQVITYKARSELTFIYSYKTKYLEQQKTHK